MKKILICLLFISCENKIEEFDRVMTELKPPVILMAKTENAKLYSAIVVKDDNGRVATFSYIRDDGSSALAVANTRQVGDTIKPVKTTKKKFYRYRR